MTAQKKTDGRRRVKVRKASIRFNGWDWITDGTDTYVGPCLVITNPPAGLTATKLRRLVEIAAMDYDSAFHQLAHLGTYSYSDAMVVCRFLGIKQRKPGKRGNTR